MAVATRLPGELHPEGGFIANPDGRDQPKRFARIQPRMARKAAARAEWERHTLEMIEKAKRGEIDPHYFANKAAEYENMMWVMDRIKPRPGEGRIHAALQRVVDALSAEFHRRRLGN